MESSRFREHMIGLGDFWELRMLRYSLANRCLAALCGVSALTMSLSPASAFLASGPALHGAMASPTTPVQYRRWGWGPGALIGGLAAGAIIGSAIAAPRYYEPAYDDAPRFYAPDYNSCWRREIDPWGREFWERAC
jgi:hypothetical protein